METILEVRNDWHF